MDKFWKMALEAAGWTFLQVFVVTLGASMTGVAVGDWDGLWAALASAGLAAIGAAISLVKSLVVRKLGVQDSVFISA